MEKISNTHEQRQLDHELYLFVEAWYGHDDIGESYVLYLLCFGDSV